MVPGDFLPVFRDKGLRQAPDVSVYYLDLNVRDPLLQNLKARRAISLALDRTALTGSVLKDGSEPATGFVPPSLPGLERAFRLEAGEHVAAGPAPEEARRLWQEALAETGAPPELSIMAGDSCTSKKTVQALQQMLAESPGARVNVEHVAFKVRLERHRRGDFQIVYGAWVADYLDPMTMLDIHTSDSGNNWSGWKNADYDRLIARARESGDQRTRMEALTAAARLLLAELPVIPLHFGVRSYVENRRLSGVIRLPVSSDEYKFARLVP